MPLSFDKVSLGADENGEEQHEYRLTDTVDGQKVTLLSKSAGYIEHQVSQAKEQSKSKAQSS